ncbi:MAG: glycosyl hydrolase [archaeon]
MTDKRDACGTNTTLSRRSYLKATTALGIAGAAGLSLDTAQAAFDDSEVIQVGAGSYATRKPQPDESEFTEEDQKYKYVEPSPVVHGTYLTDDAPPTPKTNTWWSHNWFTGSGHKHGGPNPTVPLPWYIDTTTDGVTAIYSDSWLTDPGETVGDRGFVKLDHRYSPRIKISQSGAGFSDSRVSGWGDFHVTVSWGDSSGMEMTFVKGSPFIFVEYGGGTAEITLADLAGSVAKPENVEVWEDRGNVLGVTISGIDTDRDYERHFGIFAPEDASWDGVDTAEVSSDLGSGDYLTVAPLPRQSTETLDVLEAYAYNIVRDTRVTHEYVPTNGDGDVVSEVRATFEFVTEDKSESTAVGSLAGLMPHQWKYSDADLTDLEYWSPRGTMKVHAGTSFQTTKTYPGVLPHLPDEGSYDNSTLESYVEKEKEADLWAEGVGSECSTYWVSKDFDNHLRTIPIAQQVGDEEAIERSIEALRKRLRSYFTVQDTTYDTSEEEEAFTYWEEFGSIIGYPAEFYSSDFVNDHNFHYGYFVKAAAELARHDEEFIEDYGEMVDLMVREYSNWERPTAESISETTPVDSPSDAFPYLRSFDAYEGHSWASGFPLGDGANQESSSEAMMAHSSIIMWAEHRMATADSEEERAEYRKMRDTAICLYTEEMYSIWEYWFDNDDDSQPDEWGSNISENATSGATGAPEGLSYDAYEYASIVWGDGYHRQTFWAQEEMEEIWGINWMPIDGHSVYLNYDEDYADANWNRMVEARGDDTDFLEGWHTAALGYRALSDPEDAVSIAESELPIGRRSAHVYHWVHNLAAMGTPNHDVVADEPQAVVFGDDELTYVAYNADPWTKTVSFSDGYSMDVPPNSLKTSNDTVTEGLRSEGGDIDDGNNDDGSEEDGDEGDGDEEDGDEEDGETPDHVAEIAQLGDGTDPNEVDLSNVQQAIGYWSDNEPIPGGTEPLTLSEIQDAIGYWAKNKSV